MERFLELGFPTTRLEAWKYTNVAPISRLTFRPAVAASQALLPDLNAFPGPRLVFVNGFLRARASDQRIEVATLSDLLADPNRAPLLERYLGRYADTANHSFVAWNTAFFSDGACVLIPPGTIVAEPIHLFFISTGGGEPQATFPRNLIVVGEGSQVALVEVFLATSDALYLTNSVTEIAGAAGAMIDYYKVEHESHKSFHIATVAAGLARDATLTSHSISLGAALARNDLSIALDGEGAHCTLDGLFLADAHRLVDNHTEIDHRRPHATSRELYKGILAGHGQGVFNGAIIVRKDAQKTDAVQHNRNLLLSEDAQINTKPQLEIRADDVRCAHGASIGQIDREALFYLNTRGVNEEDARRMLVRGFAAEILDGIRVTSIRDELERLVDTWFENTLDRQIPPSQMPNPQLDFRGDFPALHQQVHGKPLVYLDNAATTQKPKVVIDAIDHFYRADCSNVHRGVHELSVRATKAYEEARLRVRRFINAKSERETIFVRGTTEAINLVANSYGRSQLKAGDEILISALEHHSNIVPWQLLCEQVGARLVVAPINDAGELILEEFERLLSSRTRLVAVAHVSNALGTVMPVRELIQLAHARNVPVLIDGAQAAPHFSVDVRELGCDFYAFSGHKVFGPTGIGVLYGREELLDRMPPYQGGGDMIRSVTFEKTTYNDLPYKFEAGTPDIAAAIGLGAALEYVSTIGMDRIAAHEEELLNYGTKQLASISGLRLIGTAQKKAGVLSFVLDGIHPHDAGTVLDRLGIAVRTGHHCAQPVMERFGVPATTRASLAFYNTKSDLDALAEGIRRVQEVFKR
jgi:cysteine desulfurase/selenocysteine lyase